MESDVR